MGLAPKKTVGLCVRTSLVRCSLRVWATKMLQHAGQWGVAFSQRGFLHRNERMLPLGQTKWHARSPRMAYSERSIAFVVIRLTFTVSQFNSATTSAPNDTFTSDNLPLTLLA